MHKREDLRSAGFGIVEVVLVVVVIAIVGFVGWRIYDASKAKPTTTSSSQQQSSSTTTTQTGGQSQSQPADVYAGWKTYTASLKKYSFRYPPDWTVGQQSQNGLEAVTLTAPQRTIGGTAYQFSLMFRIFKPLGINSGQYNVFKSTTVSATGFSQSLYSVIDSPTSASHGKASYLYATNVSYPAGEIDKDLTILTDQASGQEVEFSGSYVTVNGKVLSYFDPTQFENMEDVQTAVKIFGSLSDK